MTETPATDAERLAVLREIHVLEFCPDQECFICAVLWCPYAEPLHYDKDGCPCEGCHK